MLEETVPHIRWSKGGDARIVSLKGDSILLRSTIPSPPGSRIEGELTAEPGGTIRVKIHSSRKQEDGLFLLDGRALDLSRAMRDRITPLVKQE